MSNLNDLVNEIFSNSFPNNLKFVKESEPSVSPSRSSAITLTGTLKNKGKSVNVFIKITPGIESIKNKMSLSEVEIYEITNTAVKKKLSPHFVHCYNKDFGIKNNVTLKSYYKIGSKLYNNFTILLIEPLQGKPLLSLMKTNSFKNNITFQVVILMQMMHVLYMLNFLGIIHYDLHYANIIIEPVSKIDGLYSYELKDNNGNFFKIYLPNVGYQIKLIDYDGSLKFKRNLNNNNFSKSVQNPNMLEIYASNTKNNYKYDMYKFLKGHPGRNDFSFINGRFGVHGQYGHFSSKYLDKISDNKNKLLDLKKNLLSKKVLNIKNEYIYQLFDLFHILVNKNGKNIKLNKGLLKSPLNFFTNLQNFKLQGQSKIIESYSIKPALKKNTVYYTPISPMNINSNVNNNTMYYTPISPMNIDSNVKSFFIKNVNIIDPFSSMILNPNDARYIIEEMQNGKITSLYSQKGLQQWMKLYNPSSKNIYRTPQGKIFKKMYTRSSLTTDEKKALQKIINKHMLF